MGKGKCGSHIPQISNLHIQFGDFILDLRPSRAAPIQRESAPFTLCGQITPDHEIGFSTRSFELDLNVSVVGPELDEGV